MTSLSHRFSQRAKNIKISATKLMPMLASEVGGCASLGQGVPSFATPPHVAEAVCRALADEPSAGKYFGGAVAGPVFSQITAGTLRTLGIAPDQPLQVAEAVPGKGNL